MSFAVLCTTLALGLTAYRPALGQPASTSPATLTGSAAANGLVGNTVVWNAGDDGLAAIFFAADHSAKLKKGASAVESGTWIMQQNYLCLLPGKKTVPDDGDCGSIEMTGNNIKMTSKADSSTVTNFILLQGNPFNL